MPSPHPAPPKTDHSVLPVIAVHSQLTKLGVSIAKVKERRAAVRAAIEAAGELPSLAEAWRLDREGQMWLASADHQGRPCFRVFWGRYSDLESARQICAMASYIAIRGQRRSDLDGRREPCVSAAERCSRSFVFDL
jgi:hypothetical protein